MRLQPLLQEREQHTDGQVQVGAEVRGPALWAGAGAEPLAVERQRVMLDIGSCLGIDLRVRGLEGGVWVGGNA